jgi:hypothetical protein
MKMPRRQRANKGWSYPLTALQDIVARVRRHEISQQEAEDEAASKGLAPLSETLFVPPSMLEPITSGSAGYVPFCSALHWIMTSRGTRQAAMDDEAAWNSSVQKLLPLICEEEIELIGLRCGRSERIPGHALAFIRVLSPLDDSIGNILLNAPSHIACSPYLDQKHWSRDCNDKLYEQGQTGATWTHLQVRKTHVLSKWPKPGPTARSGYDCKSWLIEQMQKSPDVRPKPKSAFWDEAKKMLPPLGRRQFDREWNEAIKETDAYNWKRAGAPKRSGRPSRTDGI